MIFDLEAEQGEWFNFFRSSINPNTGEIIYEEPVSDARVQIRSMAPFIEERMANRKRQVEHILNPKTRTMERLSYYPDLTSEELKKERDDIWDYAITGWENFKDAKTGTLIECTRENKLKLMKLPLFDRFMARCLQLLEDSRAKEKEAIEKN